MCRATNQRRWYLKRSGGFAKLQLLPPYSPFLNPAEWLWRKGRASIRRTFRRPAEIYNRRNAMLVCESLKIRFNPRNILFRNLDGMFLT